MKAWMMPASQVEVDFFPVNVIYGQKPFIWIRLLSHRIQSILAYINF